MSEEKCDHIIGFDQYEEEYPLFGNIYTIAELAKYSYKPNLAEKFNFCPRCGEKLDGYK